MAEVRTTSGAAIKKPPQTTVTIYAPDGTPHKCAPVDAREILASGNGYTATLPEPVVEVIAEESAEVETKPKAKAGKK